MRLIDADALVGIPWVLPNRMTSKTALECFENIIKDAPTIEAEPVRHGKFEDYNTVLNIARKEEGYGIGQISEEDDQLKAQNAELLEKVKQLERERDALFEALRTNRNLCSSCKHNPGYGYGCTSVAKADGSCWEWRGLCEENGGAYG
jgi:hypothetical protein